MSLSPSKYPHILAEMVYCRLQTIISQMLGQSIIKADINLKCGEKFAILLVTVFRVVNDWIFFSGREVEQRCLRGQCPPVITQTMVLSQEWVKFKKKVKFLKLLLSNKQQCWTLLWIWRQISFSFLKSCYSCSVELFGEGECPNIKMVFLQHSTLDEHISANKRKNLFF